MRPIIPVKLRPPDVLCANDRRKHHPREWRSDTVSPQKIGNAAPDRTARVKDAAASETRQNQICSTRSLSSQQASTDDSRLNHHPHDCMITSSTRFRFAAHRSGRGDVIPPVECRPAFSDHQGWHFRGHDHPNPMSATGQYC